MPLTPVLLKKAAIEGQKDSAAVPIALTSAGPRVGRSVMRPAWPSAGLSVDVVPQPPEPEGAVTRSSS